MTFLFIVWLVGVAIILGMGMGFAMLGAMFGMAPSDKTVLKYMGFAAAWPVTIPYNMIRDNIRK